MSSELFTLPAARIWVHPTPILDAFGRKLQSPKIAIFGLTKKNRVRVLRKKSKITKKKSKMFCQLFPQRTQTSSCSPYMKISANSRKNGAKNVIFSEKFSKKKCPPY